MQADSTKRCSACRAYKPRSAFNRNRSRKDGLTHACRECTKEQKRQEYQRNKAQYAVNKHAAYLKNREQVIDAAKRYYEQHKEKISAQRKARRKADKEHVNRLQRERYAANREQMQAIANRRYAANPEPFKTSARNRRALLKGSPEQHTLDDVEAKHREQQGLCYWCATPLPEKFHVDHIVPLSKGGGNGPGNICCSCPPCNWRKNDKMPWEFSDRLF